MPLRLALCLVLDRRLRFYVRKSDGDTRASPLCTFKLGFASSPVRAAYGGVVSPHKGLSQRTETLPWPEDVRKTGLDQSKWDLRA